MKLRLRGSPLFAMTSTFKPDADNAAVGKYVSSIAAGEIACGFSVIRRQKPLQELQN